MKRPILVLACSALLFGQNAKQRQAPAASTDESRITVDVTRVNLLYTVTDKKGRFVSNLTKDDFVRILHEPQNSLVKQQVALIGTEGIELEFGEDAIDAMAQIAYDLNRRTQNIGARRLYTILERVVEKISFEGADSRDKSIEIDAKYVKDRLKDVLGDEDLSKFIL